MSRILTGDRPTGALHLGHYFGTLANRVALQRQGHELFVVIADYQVIADRDHPGDLRTTITEIVRDYLAIGLDADETVVFPHSAVPAINQLLLPFLSLVGMGELQRNPTVKDEIRYAGARTVSGLMFTYPVHQAADILFCKGELVPVGRDQLPHLELTRTIARRFNERYAPIFPLPEALVGEAPVLPGLDGRKMSKSLGNAIALCDDRATIAAKLRGARTDSEPTITFEPDRRPQIATLLTLAGLCAGRSPQELAAEVGCGGGGALKELALEAVDGLLAPIRERRAAVSDEDVRRLLKRGVQSATAIADEMLDDVRRVMGMDVVTL
ncbi:MAG TPA: tryptophan--tRNA ligase [Jatrophihabitantaceae bacterium]|jgi:tryptophanyl-tRNA synthetase|nr:tryptophan--tRNA ligase [Jatrophihabitantaceae bacterium]